MNFQDLVAYTATQASAITFNLTLTAGYQDMPTGVERVVYIKDDANKYCVVDATRAGAVLSVVRVRESTEANNAVPTFGSGIQIYSNVSAQLFANNFKGRGAIVCIGQSNHIGWDPNGNTDSVDVGYGDVWQYRHKTLDTTGTPTSTAEDGPQALTYPLKWYRESTGLGKGSPVVHMANALYLYEGHKAPIILPGAKDGSGYSTGDWQVGQPAYENVKDMLIQFLNENDDNYIICMVDVGGESDTVNGVPPVTYQGYFDTMYNGLRSAVQTATGYDMTNTPLIVAGMPDVISSFPNFNNIQSVRSDTPNRIPFSSYIDMTGQPAVDSYHHAIAATRYMGRVAFLPAYRAALANFPDVQSITNVTGSLVEVLNGATSTASGTVALPAGAVTGTLNQTLGATGISSAGTVNNAPSETPLTDALAPTIQLRGARGFTLNGPDVQTWQNFGSGVDAIQNTAVDQPLESSGSVVFDEANTEFLELASEVFSNASGFSVVFEMAITSGNGGTVLNDGQSRIFPTTAMQFVTLGDTTVSYAQDNRDGVLRTYRWVTDGSTVDIWEDGVQKITAQSLTTAGSPTGLILGAFSSSLFHGSCTIRNFVAKPAVQWNATEMSNIESEWL